MMINFLKYASEYLLDLLYGVLKTLIASRDTKSGTSYLLYGILIPKMASRDTRSGTTRHFNAL